MALITYRVDRRSVLVAAAYLGIEQISVIARRAGVGQSHLRAILAGRVAGVETARRLAAALEVALSDIATPIEQRP